MDSEQFRQQLLDRQARDLVGQGDIRLDAPAPEIPGAAPTVASTAPAVPKPDITNAVRDNLLVHGLKAGGISLSKNADKVMQGVGAILFPDLANENPSVVGGMVDEAARKYQAAKDILTGLMGMAGAALGVTSTSTTISETIKRQWPELHAAEVLPDALKPYTPYIRAAMGEDPGTPGKEDWTRMNRPLTFGDLVEFGAQVAIPVVGAKAIQAARAKPGATETAPGAPAAAPAAEAPKVAPEPAPIAVPAEAPTVPAPTFAEGAARADVALSKIEGLSRMPSPTEIQSVLDRVQTETVPAMPEGYQGGPRVFGVNWQRLGTEERVKNVILQVNKDLAGRGEMPQVEGAIVPTTAPDVLARAKELGVTLDDVMRLPELPTRIKSVEQLDAFTTGVRAVRDTIANRLTAEAELAVRGDVAARENVPALMGLLERAALGDKLTGENVAQALSARRIASEAMVSGTPPSAVMDAVARLKGLTDADRLPEMLTSLKSKETGGFLSDVGAVMKTGKDVLWDVFVNDLLGPLAVGAKTIGDTIMLAKEPPARLLARWNQQVFRPAFRNLPPGEQIAPGEGWAFGAAAAQKIPTAIFQMLKSAPGHLLDTLRSGKPGPVDIYTGVGQAESRPGAVSSARWNLPPDTAPAYLVNAAGMLIRVPGTTLGIITKIAKAANYAGEAAAQAVRQAFLEGHDPAGASFKERVQYITEHPAEFPYIADAATKTAASNTFTQDLGTFGDALTTALNTAHLRAQSPFLRIPINLEKMATHMAAPFNLPSLLWGEMRRDLEAGGVRRAQAMTAVEVGGLFAATIAALTANGLITGYGPRDPALQKNRELAGRPVHSLFIPGTDIAIDYNRIKPVGTMIGLTATATEAWAQLPNDADAIDRMGQLAIIHGLAWARVIQDASYFTGIKQVTDALSAKDATLARAAQQALLSFARSVPPNTWMRAPNRLYFDTIMREAHTVQDAFLAGVPGYSTDLAPHRDALTGVPMEYPPAFSPSLLMPIQYRPTDVDPVRKMLMDNDIPIHALPWVLPATGPAPVAGAFHLQEQTAAGEGVPLTDKQRDRWIVLMTQDVRIGGRTLYESLDHLLHVPAFQTASTGPGNGQDMQVQALVSGYREEARLRLLREDAGLRENFLQRTKAKLEGTWLPTTNPRSPQFPGRGPAGSGDVGSLLQTLGR